MFFRADGHVLRQAQPALTIETFGRKRDKQRGTQEDKEHICPCHSTVYSRTPSRHITPLPPGHNPARAFSVSSSTLQPHSHLTLALALSPTSNKQQATMQFTILKAALSLFLTLGAVSQVAASPVRSLLSQIVAPLPHTHNRSLFL